MPEQGQVSSDLLSRPWVVFSLIISELVLGQLLEAVVRNQPHQARPAQTHSESVAGDTQLLSASCYCVWYCRPFPAPGTPWVVDLARQVSSGSALWPGHTVKVVKLFLD